MAHIANYIEVQPNMIRQGVALVEQYCHASRGESGCARIEAFQEMHRLHRFVIIEAWDTDLAWEAHESGDHARRFRSELGQIHKSPCDQRVHQPFAVGASAGSGETRLVVVTHVDVPPPRKDETEALLKATVDEVRSGQGNERFDILQQKARANHFTLVAVWNNADAFAGYEMNAHTRQFRETLGPMLGALYDERLYRSLSI